MSQRQKQFNQSQVPSPHSPKPLKPREAWNDDRESAVALTLVAGPGLIVGARLCWLGRPTAGIGVIAMCSAVLALCVFMWHRNADDPEHWHEDSHQ